MARRLLITYLTITALTLAVIVVPLGRIFAQREHDLLTFDLERDAQNVASLVEDALEAGVTPALDSELDTYHGSGGRIVVVDREGHTVADSKHPDRPPRDYSTRPEIAAALDGDRTSGTRPSETLGGRLVFVAVPVASGGVVHGAVRITYPMSTLEARTREAWIRLGVLSGVVLGIVAVVGVVFARSVTRPLRELESASRQLATGDLQARVPAVTGAPELVSLATTFNATADKLEQLVESQRRFVADASHQLRTPLTALRLRLETLEPALDESAQPKLEAAITETDRLARLVHSLLVLARGDAAAGTCEPQRLDDLIQGRLDSWEPLATERGIDLISTGERGLSVQAVPGAIEQILDNLIANALDVVEAGRSITIAVHGSAESVALHVIDQGPGMGPDQRRLALERFWRQPQGGDGGRGGFGLGLAIVDQLARRCGGRVHLEEGPGGVGLDAVVELATASGNRQAGRTTT